MEDKNEYCKHALTLGVFSSDILFIQLKWSVFKEKGSSKKIEDAYDSDDLEEDQRDEFIDPDDENDDIRYQEGEAYSMLTKGDIAVVRSGADHPYYLLQIICEPYETQSDITDDYQHSFSTNQRVIQGNYLEMFKEVRDGDIYYVDKRRSAIVSSLCVVGVCPELKEVTHKRRGSEETMLMVDGELHQALCELVNSCDLS